MKIKSSVIGSVFCVVLFLLFLSIVMPKNEIEVLSSSSQISIVHHDTFTPTEKPLAATKAFTTTRPTVTTKPFTTPRPTVTANIIRNERTYILNTNTHKFHYPDCRSVKQMKEKNKRPYTGTRNEVIAMGYDPCGNCHP